MAELKSMITVDPCIVLKLTEEETRAIDALAGYGIDSFLETFYHKMGRSYLEPYEQGLRSLFITIRTELPKHISKCEKVKEVIKGK